MPRVFSVASSGKRGASRRKHGASGGSRLVMRKGKQLSG
jgi:hypothetical protein